MKYTLVLLSFLFLYNNTAQAQLIPGYMGKRHFFELGAIIGLNHFEARQALTTRSANGQDGIPFPLAARPELSYNYVLSRKTVVHAEYSYSPFKISTGESYDNVLGIVVPNPDYQVFSHGFGVGFDFYPIKKRPHMLAPLGKYIRIGLHVVNNRRALTGPFANDARHTNRDEEIVFTTAGLKLGMGYRAVIGERFLLSFNVQTVIFPTTIPVPGGLTRLYYYSDPYREQLAVALQERYLLGARIALGILL